MIRFIPLLIRDNVAISKVWGKNNNQKIKIKINRLVYNITWFF